MFFLCGYVVGIKCICFDYGYYEIFNLDYVYLVDLIKILIFEMMEKGIWIFEKDYVFDVIVYVIGFDVIIGILI